MYARTGARVRRPVRCYGRLRLQGSQIIGFVCRTLGCGLDTRNLISQADSENVHVQPNGTGDPYHPMPVLAIFRVL